MTERNAIKWIKDNLGPIIRDTIHAPYTEDWLGAMVMREVGVLLYKYLSVVSDPLIVSTLMKGDYITIKGQDKPQPQGYGFWQIDIKSFPEFIASEDWKDPHQCCRKAVSVLDGKRDYLLKKFKLTNDELDRATTAAYNCGEGNVSKCIIRMKDIDSYTSGKNYSKDTWRIRQLYLNIA